MPGIPSRLDLQFDLFDSLGLNPTASTITPSSVQQAWRRVNLHLHPDKILAATHLPAFPTYVQARQAKDYLLAEENGATDAQSRIYIALASGKHSYRSTWNPWATPNTEDVLKPIPGAPTVASHGPAESQGRQWAKEWRAARAHPHHEDCECDSCITRRRAEEWRTKREQRQAATDEFWGQTTASDDDDDEFWRLAEATAAEWRANKDRVYSTREEQDAADDKFWEGRAAATEVFWRRRAARANRHARKDGEWKDGGISDEDQEEWTDDEEKFGHWTKKGRSTDDDEE
ncbi:hypothetical protein MMC27_001434 [Xylographa pallens]|nr:hypothetical protein [Xylographa pallens]